MKVAIESPVFLEKIQGEICVPIQPTCGSFRYFMVLVDTSVRWSHVRLIMHSQYCICKIFYSIDTIKGTIPEQYNKDNRLDNAGKFISQSFNDYYISIGINVEYLITHTHTQNGPAESFIKRFELIARPLLIKIKE